MTDVQTVLPKKKKRAYVTHIETRNISFLQTARDLKRLGIKNNMFFLRLYDESLKFVDPHSPFLTEQQAIAIINECVINPWYFIRECARIPEQGGNGIPYQLHRGNLAATYCFLMGLDHYLVLPRQKGKTQSTVTILDWAFLFGTTNSEFMFINKKQEDANNNLDRLKQQRDLLPSFMRMKEIVTDEGKIEKGTDNVKTITNPTTGNKIVTKPSARSIEAAEGLGRGCTQPIQYYDETEFTPFIKTIIEAAGPAYNTASANAKRNNAAYCRIFTSTPGDLDTQPGQDCIQIIEQTCNWTEQFYDWTKEEIDDYISVNSGNGIIYIEYQYQQLGDDEEWFRRTSQTLLNNPAKIKREIFLQRMRGSSESPFETEEMNAIQDLKGKIKQEVFINKMYKLDIYEELKRDRIYIIGVDCAQGLGEDNSAATIIDPYTTKPVAEFKSPYIGTTDTVKFLRTLVKKHVPKAILAIERNNVGTAIIDGLRETDVRGNVYFDDSRDIEIDDKLDAQGFLARQASRRKLYGVWTGSKSRDIMMTILEAHVKEYKDKFITENITNDLVSLVRKKSGKIEHAPGFHDDSLMSYLIALYIFYHGKNLHRFGFVKGELPDEKNANKGLTYEEIYEEMPEEMKQEFAGFSTKTIEDQSLRMRQEIENARREMSQYDSIIKATNSAENFETMDEDNDIGDSFFDDLNS